MFCRFLNSKIVKFYFKSYTKSVCQVKHQNSKNQCILQLGDLFYFFKCIQNFLKQKLALCQKIFLVESFFNIYINDVPIFLKNPHFGGILTLTNHENGFLLFADNLTTTELSEQEHLNKINVLKNYCQLDAPIELSNGPEYQKKS